MHLRKSWVPSSILSTQKITNTLKGMARDVVVSVTNLSDIYSDFTEDCKQGVGAIYQFNKDRLSRIPHNVRYLIHNPIGFGKSAVVSTVALAMMPAVVVSETIQAFKTSFNIDGRTIEQNYVYQIKKAPFLEAEFLEFEARRSPNITLLPSLPFSQSSYNLSTELCPNNWWASSSSIYMFSYKGNMIGVVDKAYESFRKVAQKECENTEERGRWFYGFLIGFGCSLVLACVVVCGEDFFRSCSRSLDAQASAADDEAKSSADAMPLLSEAPADIPLQEHLEHKNSGEDVRIAVSEVKSQAAFFKDKKRNRLAENLPDERPMKRPRHKLKQ